MQPYQWLLLLREDIMEATSTSHYWISSANNKLQKDWKAMACTKIEGQGLNLEYHKYK